MEPNHSFYRLRADKSSAHSSRNMSFVELRRKISL